MRALSPGRAVLAALAVGVAVGADASPQPEGELELRCWQSYSRERTRVDVREPTAVSFSNLRDGYRVRSPFSVEFAVRGKGIAPAGVAIGGTGHHHILVNRALPTRLGEPLPFDDQHRHFGKGQTSTLLDLPPGRHTLRLLFADHEHRPFFVYSREITVEVLGRRSDVPRPRIVAADFAATCAAWYQDAVSSPAPPDEPLRFLNVRADEPLVSPFNLRLGVEGFGICATGPDGAPAPPPKTGTFLVDVIDAASRRTVQAARLTNGATQLNVAVDPGAYRLRLRLVDAQGTDLLPAHELPVRVLRSEAL